VNRDDLIAYLLHKLPESEREAFEDRWVEDPALYQQVQDAEAELLDAYARDALSREDRDRVAKYLLDSAVQRRKLLFARKLIDAFPAPARPSIAWRSIASAAAIVLLAGAASWLAWQNATMRRASASAVNAPPPSPVAEVYVAEVRPGTTRAAASAIAQVRLPAGSQILRLDLELAPGDEAQALSASVSRDSRAVWSEEPIRAERRSFGFVAPVWVPAAALASGEYEIKLSAGGIPIDYYRFRLVAGP
jgi:hypothetical protein